MPQVGKNAEDKNHGTDDYLHNLRCLAIIEPNTHSRRQKATKVVVGQVLRLPGMVRRHARQRHVP
jgi:hypothetical protein